MHCIRARHDPSVTSSTYPSTDTIAEALASSAPDSALHSFMMHILCHGMCYPKARYDRATSTYIMGHYISNDMSPLERVPGLMGQVLGKVLLYSTGETEDDCSGSDC